MSKHGNNQDKGLPSWFPTPNQTLPISYANNFSSMSYKAFTIDDALINQLQTGQRYVYKKICRKKVPSLSNNHFPLSHSLHSIFNHYYGKYNNALFRG